MDYGVLGRRTGFARLRSAHVETVARRWVQCVHNGENRARVRRVGGVGEAMRTLLSLLLLTPLAAIAHIGSPNVFYEGTAGPYALQVVVRPPDVIPGLAEVSVRALDGNVHGVSVLPARWDTGT